MITYVDRDEQRGGYDILMQSTKLELSDQAESMTFSVQSFIVEAVQVGLKFNCLLSYTLSSLRFSIDGNMHTVEQCPTHLIAGARFGKCKLCGCSYILKRQPQNTKHVSIL